MKKKVLIVDNGFKEKKPFLIYSFENNTGISVKTIYNFHNKRSYNLLEKIFLKLRQPIDSSGFNKRIIKAVINFKPDIILIIKGNNIFPKTLKIIKSKLKDVGIHSWTADNMIKKHNSSKYFEDSICLYDSHFTTKSNIVDSLFDLGAKKVVFLKKAYSKFHHYPEKYDKEYDYNVLFIGSAEKERYDSMKYIANHGISVNIFGNMWDKNYLSINNLNIHRKALIGESYRKAISSSKISLCFLRKINDDLQTSRTMEIPACRGLMIAERTNEHLQLFKEDKEAIFFDSNKELLDKVIYYLKNPNLAEKIRNAGYNRAISSGYSFDEMTKTILKEIN